MSRPVPLLLLLLALGLFLLPAATRAERKSADASGVAPPQPVEMNIRVRREGRTEITLRIYGHQPVSYIVRATTEHGRLSEPQAVDQESAKVIYDPPADLSIKTDKFLYSSQSALGVSAPALVSITIVDQPPQLVITDSLDFGTVRTGGSATRMLELSNKGGLVATGEISVEPPWKIEGKAGYRLKSGEVAVFKLHFQPLRGGDLDGFVRYSSDREHSTRLHGVGEAPFITEPDRFELVETPGEPTRTGAFEIVSQLDEPRTVTIKPDPRLKMPAEIALPARGRVTVKVEAAPAEVHAWDAEVELASGDLTVSVPVHVPALGPIVRPVESTIDFGKIIAGQKPHQNVTLENIGGAPAAVSWSVPHPFEFSESSAVLKVGEKRALVVNLNTTTPERYRTWIEFTASAQKFDIPVTAEVVTGRPPAMARGPGSSSTGGDAADSTAAPSNPAAPAPSDASGAANSAALAARIPAEFLNEASLLPGVRVGHFSPTSVTILWPRKLTSATQFRIDMAQYQIGPDHRLAATWLHPTGIPIALQGEDYAATLDGLLPGQRWTIRVIPIDSAGQPGIRLFTMEFYTPTAPAPWFKPRTSWLVYFLLASLAGLLGWRAWEWWKRFTTL